MFTRVSLEERGCRPSSGGPFAHVMPTCSVAAQVRWRVVFVAMAWLAGSSVRYCDPSEVGRREGGT